MLSLRVIPCLDVDAGRVVKGTKFLNLRDAGDPVEVAKRYNVEGADELVFLDITASAHGRPIMLDVVKKTAEQVFIPLTVGGGLKTIEDIRKLLKAGADKVSLNTSAVQNPPLIRESSRKFGNQCIVVAIDAKRTAKNSWEVYTHGGRKATGLDADGTKNGYDNALLKAVSSAVSIPVIASGGAGKKQHFFDAYRCGASAVLAASLFHFRELPINGLKKYLKSKKVPVRI